MTITLEESLCGFTKSIKYLDNTNIKITMANMVRNNDIIVMKGYGMTKYNSNERGDLLIKINKYGVNKTCILNSDCHKIREHVKSGKDNIYKYPLYNTSGNPYEFFSSKPHKDQYIKKVIMSCSGKLSPIYDDGKLGTTQDSMYFIVETQEEGLFLVDILNSNLYKFL